MFTGLITTAEAIPTGNAGKTESVSIEDDKDYRHGMFRKKMKRVNRKPVLGVSDQVRHKPGCTFTEDG